VAGGRPAGRKPDRRLIAAFGAAGQALAAGEPYTPGSRGARRLGKMPVLGGSNPNSYPDQQLCENNARGSDRNCNGY